MLNKLSMHHLPATPRPSLALLRRLQHQRWCPPSRHFAFSRCRAAAEDAVWPEPAAINTLKPQSRWNAVAMAFLGDAVWEVSRQPWSSMMFLTRFCMLACTNDAICLYADVDRAFSTQMSVRQAMFRASGPVSAYVSRTQGMASAKAQVCSHAQAGPPSRCTAGAAVCLQHASHAWQCKQPPSNTLQHR